MKAADYAQDKFDEIKSNPKVQETLNNVSATAGNMMKKADEFTDKFIDDEKKAELKEKFDKTAKVVDENMRKAADFAQDKFEELNGYF